MYTINPFSLYRPADLEDTEINIIDHLTRSDPAPVLVCTKVPTPKILIF